MTEDMLKANAMERATTRPHSTFPFNRLPREIIAEIFCNFVHGPRETVWISASSAPLLLCRVCSSWRALAQVTPALWTSIGIRTINQNDIDQLICTRINPWLERSGTLPLTVTIDHIHYGDPSSRPNVLDAILIALCSHSSRWQNVDITAWVPVALPQLEVLPLLREFHLRLFIPEEFKNVISLPFSESPRLTRLSWPHPLDVLTDPRVPWSQMSHLCLATEISLFSALETIRLCPQLEDFATSISEENHGYRHPTTVENHRLRTLEISFGTDCSPFFDSLFLPRLSECSLMGTTSDGTSGHRAFLDFLTRSNCELHRLDLCFCAFGPFVECLEHKSFKNLENLKIEELPRFTDVELIGLVDFPSPGPRVLLPKLTHLTLVCCLYASKGLLAEMVRSRRHQQDGHDAEPLQYIHVVNDALYEEDVNFIEDEIKGGFNGRVDVTELIYHL